MRILEERFVSDSCKDKVFDKGRSNFPIPCVHQSFDICEINEIKLERKGSYVNTRLLFRVS